jgi:hypothetical protein
LTLVPTRSRTAANIDAVLLDDADLEFLPLLLAGERLADMAFLVRGAGRHLLSAPGGLLTELGVGEPLTWIGPGSIYVPVGYRLNPPVGPSARAALFQPEESAAQVILHDARLRYNLASREPVWTLWAGPLPALDLHLPDSVTADLHEVALAVDDPLESVARGEQPTASQPTERIMPPADSVMPSADPTAWLVEAYSAERAGDYAAAAQLYARHNEPVRAARMWEREAEEKRVSG